MLAVPTPPRRRGRARAATGGPDTSPVDDTSVADGPSAASTAVPTAGEPGAGGSPAVPATSTATRRTERLLNLLIALLSTRSRLTKDQLRTAVPQYAECATDEAFDRMFERDKEELRELGVPVLAAPMSAWFDDELGYAVDREAYALPEVEFTSAELAVLGLASRVWQQASLAGPAARALAKLSALGVEPDEDSLVGIEPRVRTSEPAFDALYAAARDRAVVTFEYRALGADATTRHVEPWQVRSWRGHWYLIGHDRDREDVRVFRLSRVRSAVTRTGRAGAFTPPDDVDAVELLTRFAPSGPTREAVLHLRAGLAASLRARAGADPVQREVTVSFTDVEELSAQVAAAGADARALAPDDLVAAVERRLSAVFTAHEGAPPDPPPSAAPATRTPQRPAAPPRASPPSAAERLSRLLAMVPWLLAHQGVELARAAQHFGITTDQLVADLELLFVCGTPGHMPDDLIEAEWSDGRIFLGNASAIARPLRLTLDEALALLAGLRTLADLPTSPVRPDADQAGEGQPAGEDGADAEALASATVKLSQAAGESVASARAVRVDLAPRPSAPVDPAGSGDPAATAATVLALARQALAGRRRVHLRYLVPARDEVTERDVDPMRLLALDGHWYLEGWCHRAEGVRLFRLDRVLDAHVLAVDGTPPEAAVERDVGERLFIPSPDDPVVTLELAPRASWLVEQYPAATVTELPEGKALLFLATADPRWVPRLVLSLGGAATVIAPPDLRALVAASARAALGDAPR